MDINLTFFGEMITFSVFVWVTVKYVWPPLIDIMEERRRKIADGLAAAEKGKHELEIAQIKVRQELSEAKKQAKSILEQANQRARCIVEEGKLKAKEEGDQLLEIAEANIAREYSVAQGKLRKEVSKIAVASAERILQREVDKKSNDYLIKEIIGEI